MKRQSDARHIRLAHLVAPLVLLLAPTSAWALKADAEQPIFVEADSAEIDDAKKSSTYRGNVVITQGTLRLDADKVVVLKSPAKNGNNLFADGRPAKFQQEIEGKKGEYARGQAKRVEYNSNSELLYLIDDATLTQEGSSFSSDRIIYDRIKSLVRGGASAAGKKRVRMTIQSGPE